MMKTEKRSRNSSRKDVTVRCMRLYCAEENLDMLLTIKEEVIKEYNAKAFLTEAKDLLKYF